MAYLGARKSLTVACVVEWGKSTDVFMNLRSVEKVSTGDILRTANRAICEIDFSTFDASL